MSGAPLNWEYSNYPNAADVEVACNQIIAAAKADMSRVHSILADTRAAHREMFLCVVPAGHDYVAGNYRGAPFPMLQLCGVMIPNNGKMYVGHPPALVAAAMTQLHQEIASGLQKLRERAASLNWTRQKKIVAFGKWVGSVFVKFLAIHPFMNGNGHVSRLVVWCLFAITSINASFWQVPHRNIAPPDSQVALYRDGYTEPLLTTFIQLIASENGDVVL